MNTFALAIERLRRLEFLYGDEGEERVRIEPPATPEQRSAIEQCLGRPLPSELARFLDVTAGFGGGYPAFGGATLDLADTPVTLAQRAGRDGDRQLAGLLEVFDYGNGDGMYLEPAEPACRLWWFGHDSWSICLVARSLEEYVKRSAEFLEGCMRYDGLQSEDDDDEDDDAEQDDHEPEDDPVPPYQPRWELAGTRVEEMFGTSDDEGRQRFLRELPPASLVFDLSEAETPIELSVDVVSPQQVRLFGDLVAVLPATTRF